MSRHNRDRRRKPKYADEAVKAAGLAKEAGLLRPGQVFTLPVFHDDWCALLAGRGPCNCNPVVGEPTPLPEPPN